MPYTPTERNRVGEFLMQGIAGASDNLAKGIQQWRQNKEESAGLQTALDTSAQQFLNDPEFQNTFGDKLAKSPGMSASQRRSLLGELALFEQRRQQNDQRQFQLAQIRNFEADNARANTALQLQQDAAGQQKAQMEALAAFARDYGAPAIPGVSSPAMLDAAQLPPGERLRQALGRNPGALTPQMLQTLVRYGDEGLASGNPMPLPFEAGGMRGIYSPKTGQFQADKPEPPQKDARISVVLERDEFDRPARTWSGSPEQYEKQFGKPINGAAGGGDPSPLPKSKDQLKAGQVYQTARGPARWNGNAFEPIQ